MADIHYEGSAQYTLKLMMQTMLEGSRDIASQRDDMSNTSMALTMRAYGEGQRVMKARCVEWLRQNWQEHTKAYGGTGLDGIVAKLADNLEFLIEEAP